MLLAAHQVMGAMGQQVPCQTVPAGRRCPGCAGNRGQCFRQDPEKLMYLTSSAGDIPVTPTTLRGKRALSVLL